MKALRFRPPEIEATPELLWVLARAFGPADLPFTGDLDGPGAFALADRLDLAPRIGARIAQATLALEAGAAAADFRRAALAVAVQNLLRIEAVQVVAALAASEGISFALLKGLALESLRAPLPGARRTGDLDLLVPVRHARPLVRRLVASGWRACGYRDHEHHLDPLVHPDLGTIEVHLKLVGVRPAGGTRSFAFDSLDEAGFLHPAPALPENVRVPSRAVLVAHLLVHGLVQHGVAPASYPLLRLPADLLDLGASPALLAEAAPLLCDLDDDDLTALSRLLQALGSGLPSTLCATAQSVDGRPDPSEVLLRHMVAGATVAAYGASMKARPGFYLRLTDASAPVAAARYVRNALLLTRTQIDAIYGQPRSRFGYLARRLARPFDLAARYLRARKAGNETRGREAPRFGPGRGSRG